MVSMHTVLQLSGTNIPGICEVSADRAPETLQVLGCKESLAPLPCAEDKSDLICGRCAVAELLSHQVKEHERR